MSVWEIFGHNQSIFLWFQSNRLHVDILQFFFIKFEYILQYVPQMVSRFPKVLKFNRLSSKLNGSSVISRFCSFIGEGYGYYLLNSPIVVGHNNFLKPTLISHPWWLVFN